MFTFKILKTATLAIVLSFTLQLNTVVFAKDCKSNTPVETLPGNRTNPPDWRDPYKPKIYSNNDEIARNNYVNVWVFTEGRACPAYSWSVSGTGFHFDSASGPTTATTNADMEILQLWADGTACGSATITVNDLCGGNDEEYVRCTTGHWVLKQDKACVMPGSGIVMYTASNYAHVELVAGYRKQVQRTWNVGGGSGFLTKAAAEAYAESYCVNEHCQNPNACIVPCSNCIDPGADAGGNREIPYRVWYEEPPNRWRYNCYCVHPTYLYYMEWECW